MPRKDLSSKNRCCEVQLNENIFKAATGRPARELGENSFFDMSPGQVEKMLSKTDPCKLVWTMEWLGSRELGEDPLFNAKPPEPKLLEKRLRRDVKRPRGARERYALILSGYNNAQTIKEIPIAYRALIKEGFREQNIYVLDNNYLTNYLCPTDDVATKKSFEWVMGYFSKKLSNDDLLFCFFAGHGTGGESMPESAIPLWGGKQGYDLLLANEVEYQIDRIAASKVLVFSHCCCGDFALRVGHGKNIAISAAKGSNLSYGDSFVRPLF